MSGLSKRGVGASYYCLKSEPRAEAGGDLVRGEVPLQIAAADPAAVVHVVRGERPARSAGGAGGALGI